MSKNAFCAADILIPKQSIDMNKWSVIACDQFTSEPQYWQQVKEIVGDSPSALNITLPEIFLETSDIEEEIIKINRNMNEYLTRDIFDEYKSSYIYVERTLRDGSVRKGLMGAADLEKYDFSKGSQSEIRATEGTVLSRIPPRVRVRKDAPLELPHIMLLIDDINKTVIEPLAGKKERFKKVYDFALMQDSGSIKGYLVDSETAASIDSAIEKLADRQSFEAVYGSDKGILTIAVGDGNHSLATAKECYEQLKKADPNAANSPARYALCELSDLNDETLQFEPIHRVVFDIDTEHFKAELAAFYDLSDHGEGQSFTLVCAGERSKIVIKNPTANLAVGSVQNFIDNYLEKFGGRCDYIHGEDVTVQLGSQKGNVGILLPAMEKGDLFKTVILDGALPRKTFSMGHAWDKRFYLEARKIKR